MSKFNLKEKVVASLSQANSKMTAREIAEWIVKRYPEEVKIKEQNKKSDTAIETQISAEVGAVKDSLKKLGISWNENSPRQYFMGESIIEDTEQKEVVLKIREEEEYPMVSQYLYDEFGILSKRINEKKSKNNKGKGANKHLHPDIVGILVKKDLDSKIKGLARYLGQSLEVLISYEVKVQLTRNNVREHHGQTVSNSSWSHEGYLVTFEITEGAMEELRLLHAQSGIGVILINKENPSESKVVIPAIRKDYLVIETMDRLYKENADFKNFINLVDEYRLTGNLKPKDWDVTELEDN